MNRIFVILFSFFLISSNAFADYIEDEFVKDLELSKETTEAYVDYDFTPVEKLTVKLRPLEEIKSETKTFEGKEIPFEVIEDVVLNDEILIKKGEKAKAKVSVLISPGMNGIPASIIFNDFEIDGIKSSKFDDSYEKFGHDRSYFVFPLKWALTPFPPSGSFTNFIKGGHVKLKLKDVIKIGYYPNWK